MAIPGFENSASQLATELAYDAGLPRKAAAIIARRIAALEQRCNALEERLANNSPPHLQEREVRSQNENT